MNTLICLEEMPVVAACALLPKADGTVLVIHDFRRGTGLPGGTLDPGETPLACALRELTEETGLEATAYQPSPFYDGITDTGKRAQVFLVRAWIGEIRSTHEGDVYWSNRHELINARAAYPKYNGDVLKVLTTLRL